MNDAEPLLRLRGIGKNFGPVHALTDINLDIPAGQVTALVGDNGAGKSTLIKTIAGIWEPNSGEIIWQGKPVHFHSPKDATNAGIATVYQDLALADNLDIVQNMMLGHETLRTGLLDEITMENAAKKTLADLRVTTVRNIRQPVGSLSGGQRQAVAVAKAVQLDAKLVVMDEPTAALGVSQTALVLDIIEQLASRGIAVLVISHNLTDVFRVADRIAVLYLGRMVSSGPVANYDTNSTVHWMTTGTAPNGRVATPQSHGGLSSDVREPRADADAAERVRHHHHAGRVGRPARQQLRRLPADRRQARPLGRERRAARHHGPDRHRDHLPGEELAVPVGGQPGQPDGAVVVHHHARHGRGLRAAARRDRPRRRLHRRLRRRRRAVDARARRPVVGRGARRARRLRGLRRAAGHRHRQAEAAVVRRDPGRPARPVRRAALPHQRDRQHRRRRRDQPAQLGHQRHRERLPHPDRHLDRDDRHRGAGRRGHLLRRLPPPHGRAWSPRRCRSPC